MQATSRTSCKHSAAPTPNEFAHNLKHVRSTSAAWQPHTSTNPHRHTHRPHTRVSSHRHGGLPCRLTAIRMQADRDHTMRAAFWVICAARAFESEIRDAHVQTVIAGTAGNRRVSWISLLGQHVSWGMQKQKAHAPGMAYRFRLRSTFTAIVTPQIFGNGATPVGTLAPNTRATTNKQHAGNNQWIARAEQPATINMQATSHISCKHSNAPTPNVFAHYLRHGC